MYNLLICCYVYICLLAHKDVNTSLYFSVIKLFQCCRLEGAVLLAPVVNYWWRGLPANLTAEAYYQQKLQDRWALRVAHYMPWLTYWWNTQRWFPVSSAISHSPDILSKQDKELASKMADRESYTVSIQPLGGYKIVIFFLNAMH